MKNHLKFWISGIALLIIVLSIGLTIFLNIDNFGYVADGKEEIQQNIDSYQDNDGHTYVSQYLREWGFPVFDSIKFAQLESNFIMYYVYDGGLPDCLTHAKDTAKLFLDEYYDNLDLKDKTAVTDALLSCYVATLSDPYAAYRPPVETEDYNTDMSGRFSGIGVVVEYNAKENTVRVTTVYGDSPAERAGIKVGDYIHAVNGEKVSDIGYENAVYRIRGEIGTPVNITLLRDGRELTVTAIRDLVEEINVSHYIEGNIGYVEIVSFKDNTFDQFKKSIDALEKAGVEGIVFDLRNNPGGYVDSVVAVISYLVPDGTPVMSYKYNGRPEVQLVADDEDEDHIILTPVVVICNEYTASAGEIFTSAIRDYRDKGMLDATIVGTTTYKKGVMQSTFYYSLDKSSVTFTVSYYNPPYGENYHGIGVNPDVFVELDGSGTDNQLEVAFEEMEKLINAN